MTNVAGRAGVGMFVPGDEERLVEVVEHVDDDVPVGGDVDDGARELAVDADHLPSGKNRRRARLVRKRRKGETGDNACLNDGW
jgi:hypothetical protein